MTEQLSLREQLWEVGIENICRKTKKSCGYIACTAANDIDCCAFCETKCNGPCRISVAKETEH